MTEQHPASHPSLNARGAAYWKLATAYLLLLVYGALFPLSNWDSIQGGLHALFPIIWPTQVSRSDVITNLVVYLPLGLLLMLSWRPRYGAWSAIALATLAGGGLSFGLEYLQSYLPQRVPSLLDTALNITGALVGALLAKFIQVHSHSGGHLHRWRHRWFLAGALPNVGLTVLGLWAFSQLAPLVPSFDRGNLVAGIRPLLQVLVHHTAEFNIFQALGYGLSAAGLGLLAAILFKPGQPVLRHYAGFVLLVLLLKIPVVSRQLSFEAVAGVAGALLLLPLLLYLPGKGKALLAALLVLSAYTVEQLRGGPDPTAPLLAMNWIPFGEHMENLNGLADIAGDLWPFAALAYLALFLTTRNVIWIGGVLVFGYTLGLEWLQTYIPGRYPDLTDVCLAVLGWTLPWLLPRYGETAPGITRSIPPPRRGKHHSTRTVTLFLLFITLGLLAGWRLIPVNDIRAELPAEGEKRAVTQLPAPEELGLPLLDFRRSHPRLPAPSRADVARLRKENPNYLAQQRVFADQGRLYPTLVLAYIEPGSRDLSALLSKLLALQFTWRGHEQTKPVAVAYDWLYDQWTETQRAQLRAKLAEGCEYQIRYIREQRLSPYNVYLYNSPLQALMACAIALYGDDPRGDPVMAFTADYWKNRVLPVWRQIMGKNGGWHEGGEYVG
ncbi:MAG: VanZ family protein, partial [Pseudomonadota bacterium]